MALYFLNMKTFGRSDGSSAPSAAAYRSGERIRDERTGRTYDHTDRQDVMHKEILLPPRFAGADMSWATDRSNSLERRGGRRDSQERPSGSGVSDRRARASSPTRSGSTWCAALRRSLRSATDSPSTSRSTLRGISAEATPGTFMRICWPRLARCPPKVWGEKRRSISMTRIGGCSGWDRPSENSFTCGSAGRRWRTRRSSRRTSMRGSTIAVSRRRASLASPSYGFRVSRTRSSGAAAAASVAERIREDHRARLESGHEPQRTSPESGSPERDRQRAGSEDIARQAIENWLQYRREEERSGKREPTAQESAEKWAQYQRDKLKLGEARAAEIHLQRTPAAGPDRDYDLGL